MAQDKSIIIVPPISFINNTLISASPIDTDVPSSYEQIDENIENEIAIREIAQSVTDNLVISSGEGENRIIYTLSL